MTDSQLISRPAAGATRSVLSFSREYELATEPELAKRMGCARDEWLPTLLKGTSKNESFGVKLGVLGDLRGPPSGSTAWFPRNSCPTGPIFFLQAPNPGRWAL